MPKGTPQYKRHFGAKKRTEALSNHHLNVLKRFSSASVAKLKYSQTGRIFK
jgi:hypothetical protein